MHAIVRIFTGIFIVVIAAISCTNTGEKKEVITKDQIRSAFKNKSQQWKFRKNAEDTGVWYRIKTDNINAAIDEKVLESKMWRYLEQEYSGDFREKSTYSYQYKFLSEKEIAINGLCWFVSNHDPKERFITMFDGGACFFNVKFNIVQDRFYDLYVNGSS